MGISRNVWLKYGVILIAPLVLFSCGGSTTTTTTTGTTGTRLKLSCSLLNTTTAGSSYITFELCGATFTLDNDLTSYQPATSASFPVCGGASATRDLNNPLEVQWNNVAPGNYTIVSKVVTVGSFGASSRCYFNGKDVSVNTTGLDRFDNVTPIVVSNSAVVSIN